MTRNPNLKKSKRNTLIVILALISSSATLICCALPALFVMLGLGAAFATLITNLPWLVGLSEHKWWVFTIAAILIVIAGWRLHRSRNMPCPADPVEGKMCARLRLISSVLMIVAIIAFAIGLIFVIL